jgi:hypothetical protein
MSNIIDIRNSVKNLQVNVGELLNDVDDFEEHEHDVDTCSDCETIRDEGRESHDHDTWGCSDCEEMAEEHTRQQIADLDADGLMDGNWNLWQDVGEEAVREYQSRTEEVRIAIDELAQRVLGLYSTLEDTDAETVAMAIEYVTEIVYGVREDRSTLNTSDDAPKDSLTLNNTKCSCGVDHSVSNYSDNASDNGAMY